VPPEITLGTVQLGMAYGAASRYGRPDDTEAAAIMGIASGGDIPYWDTARIYGDAEARVGAFLQGRQRPRIITKLAPVAKDIEAESDIVAALEASIAASRHALRRDRLDVVMFHQSLDRLRPGAMEQLERHLAGGDIGALGASVYNPAEAAACLADGRITHLQVPFNILDGRWLEWQFRDAIASRPDVQIHVRSIFLQGLLVGPESVWPLWLDNRKEIHLALDGLVIEFGRQNRRDLCLSYVRSFPWVDSIVIGVHRAGQLREILTLAREDIFTADQCQAMREALPDVPERLLNPSKW
jgi:aryl-alcohol dehydrogenase-like predicted oxidoreductase